MPACGSMTTTLLGAAYLVEGVIRSSFPPLRQIFWVKTLTFWFGNGGASGVTSSLEDLLSVLCRFWGHGVRTLPTLLGRRRRLPLSPDPPILPSLHLPRHHFWLLRSLQSGGCFAALLVEVRLGGCFATSTLFRRMFCRLGLHWSCL
jgi:hypothetical protein